MANYLQTFLGGQGFVTNIAISSTGEMATVKDVHGGSILPTGAERWIDLPNPDYTSDVTFPFPSPTGSTPFNPTEGVEVAVAPSNPDVWAMWIGRYIIRSLNGAGGPWTTLANFDHYGLGNGTNARLYHNRMAFDPINPDILIVGVPGYSTTEPDYTDDSPAIYRCTNFTGVTPTFTALSSVPVATAGSYLPYYLVAFDPNSGSTGGATNGCYVFSYGNGLYRAQTPGNTFAAVTAGVPSTARSMRVDGFNRLCCVGTSDGNFYAFNGTSWTSVDTTLNTDLASFDIDPASMGTVVGAQRIVVASEGSYITVSTTGGATWTDFTAPAAVRSRPAGEPQWLADLPTYLSCGQIRFHPTNANELWLSQGFGVWYANPSDVGGGELTWHCKTAGMEETITNKALCTPAMAGTVLLVGWDQPCFFSENQRVFPEAGLPAYAGFSAGWDADYDPVGGKVIAGLFDGAFGSLTDWSGRSYDDGRTWERFVTQPVNPTATVASAASSIIVTFDSLPAQAVPSAWCYNVTSPDYSDAVVVARTGNTIELSPKFPDNYTGPSTGDVCRFATPQSGNIAMTSEEDIMILPNDNWTRPIHTTDGGTTWSLVDLPCAQSFGGTLTIGTNTITNLSEDSSNYPDGTGIHDLTFIIGPSNHRTVTGRPSSSSITFSGDPSAASGNIACSVDMFGWAYYLNYSLLCADRVQANTYYIATRIGNEIFRSEGGAAFVKVDTQDLEALAGSAFYAIAAVPGHAGHLVASSTGGATANMIRSTDFGETWEVVPGVTDVQGRAFDFGKAKPGGGGYPTCFFAGELDGVYGVYRSDDFEQATPTWTACALTAPAGCVAAIACLGADKNIYGRHHLGTLVQGFIHGYETANDVFTMRGRLGA